MENRIYINGNVGQYFCDLHRGISCFCPAASPEPGFAAGGLSSPSAESAPVQTPCWPAPPALPPEAYCASGGPCSPFLPDAEPPPSLSSVSQSPRAGLGDTDTRVSIMFWLRRLNDVLVSSFMLACNNRADAEIPKSLKCVLFNSIPACHT